MQKGKFVDLVIGGPDMSGTSTQVNDFIMFFKENGKVVKDIKGRRISYVHLTIEEITED